MMSDRDDLADIIVRADANELSANELADEILTHWVPQRDAAVTARAHAPALALADRLDSEGHRAAYSDELRAALDVDAATQHDTDIARQTLTDAADDQRPVNIHALIETLEYETDQFGDVGIFGGYGPVAMPLGYVMRLATANAERVADGYWDDDPTLSEPRADAALGQPHGQTGNNHE